LPLITSTREDCGPNLHQRQDLASDGLALRILDSSDRSPARFRSAHDSVFARQVVGRTFAREKVA
jgi:hypothetical protein